MTLSVEQIEIENRVVEAARKDPSIFSELYERYFETIFSFIFRRTGDEQICADLTSQSFLIAMQNLNKYEFRQLPFSAWLYRIASNEVNKYYRKSKKKIIFSLEQDRFHELIVESKQELRNEQLPLMIENLNDLPTDMLVVLELRFFEEKSFKEIAYILDISESGAKMRTYRALEKMRQLMNFTKGKEEPNDQK